MVKLKSIIFVLVLISIFYSCELLFEIDTNNYYNEIIRYNCPEIGDYLDLKVGFSQDTVSFGDSLEIKLTYINKTNDSVKFYSRSYIFLLESSGDQQIVFDHKKYKRLVLDGFDKTSLKIIEPKGKYSKTYKIKVKDETYYFEPTDLNRLC